MGDLVVLVADGAIEQALLGLFSRAEDLGIHPFDYKIIKHAGHDPGCYKTPSESLRLFIKQYRYALVIFDYEGAGKDVAKTKKKMVPSDRLKEMEKTVLAKLESNGWEKRAGVVIIQPELEVWVWSKTVEVARCLSWSGREPNLWVWLEQQGLWRKADPKPHDPKDALKHALDEVNGDTSHALFKRLAQQVPFDQCEDASFKKLRTLLQTWFSVEG